MPAVSWTQVIRPEIGRRAGGYYQFDTTTNIGASNTVVSTQLAARFPNDDYFIGWYWVMEDSDGNNDGVIRRVTDYAASTGTLTLTTPNLSAESAAMTCALYRRHPGDIRRSYNRVRRDAYPLLAAVVDFRGLSGNSVGGRYHMPTHLRERPLRVFYGRRTPTSAIPGNLLTNGDFETWSGGTPTGWTLTGAGGSVAQEQNNTDSPNYMVLHGQSSAKVVAASSTSTYLSQTVTPDVAAEGVIYTIGVWVYCTTANVVRIANSAAALLVTLSHVHHGTGWELLYRTVTLGATATTIDMVIGTSTTHGSSVALYVDEAFMVAGQPSAAEPIKWKPVLNYRFLPDVTHTDLTGTPAYGFSTLELPNIGAKVPVRVIGTDLLLEVTWDDVGSESNVQIEDYQVGPLSELVYADLLKEDARGRRGELRSDLLREASEVTVAASIELSSKSVQLPATALQIPDWRP